LVIGNKNYSSWSLRPWIFLRHNKIEFEEKWVSLFVETTEAELADYNSDYKVPVLKDGDLLVWDSLAILEYLSETYLEGKGWPSDRKARALARSISAEMHSSFFNVRNEMPMNCRKRFDGIGLSPEAKREVERIKSLWRNCRSEFGNGGDWLFGGYTIADAMYAPVALRFHGYGIALSGQEADYVACVLNQPEMKAWIEEGKRESQIIAAAEIQPSP
jgi:glutathione S-transferase